MVRLVREIAKEILGEEKANLVWSSLDIVGDIAVIRKPPSIEIEDLRILAEEMLKKLKWLKSVWAAISPIEGSYRLRRLEWLAGEKRTETLYREHGCVFKVDIARVYISPRLSYEHIRIARLVKPGENIINMFAGAGLFSIIIARFAKPARVISIDINEDAYRFMLENIELNKVQGIVIPIKGDALEIIDRYSNNVQRVLIPLPELALKAFPKALRAIDREGYIHVYEFAKARNKLEALEQVEKTYREAIESNRDVAKYSIEGRRIVRSVGPRKYQVVLDVWVKRS
ncbi:class I SAM-dependent methyltransferase family protein [Desulfurococcaceae archaeon AG1]|jgi:tRNA (guanine37-N1)-methyltransferase|nr:MAG: methyltransferase [Desulfurococcaceae archaeon]GAY25477.1 class I SAM-dependent methyltransferase family protein [Desulfurococcaceae archaeon AG1]